jgi:hypothetical protein
VGEHPFNPSTFTEHTMATHTPHKPHRTLGEEAEDDPEPGMLPVEPDSGPVLPAIPSDPEHDRTVDPEA